MTHFGLPPGTVPQALAVTWPDGRATAVTGVRAGTLVTVERIATGRGTAG